MLRTLCQGNIFEDHAETLKTLFVLWISQKTKWNFTLLPRSAAQRKVEEAQRGKESSPRKHGLMHTAGSAWEEASSLAIFSKQLPTNSSPSGTGDLPFAPQLLRFIVTEIT